nr:zinc finger protein 280B isoform X2 [Manis javanica]
MRPIRPPGQSDGSARSRVDLAPSPGSQSQVAAGARAGEPAVTAAPGARRRRRPLGPRRGSVSGPMSCRQLRDGGGPGRVLNLLQEVAGHLVVY